MSATSSDHRVSVASHLEPWRHLPDKVVMVTGASSGIGRDLCLDLAAAGCLIVAAARRTDRLRSLCDQINLLHSCASGGVRAVAVQLDVASDGPTIDASVQKAWDAFGRIHALINNAGFRGNVRTPLDLADEEWNTVIKTNLTGSWLVTKYVVKRMHHMNLEGSIINIASMAGLSRGYPKGGVGYTTSKAAVNAMSKVLALELGEHKVKVNSISPGLFKSEITEDLVKKDWLTTVVKRSIPLRTYGTSNPALTSLVRYLIHDSSEYVSGNVFIVDAGASLPGVPLFSCL